MNPKHRTMRKRWKQKAVSISQKERLTKDVRYQEFNEVTLDCTKMIDHKIMQSRDTSFLIPFHSADSGDFLCLRPGRTAAKNGPPPGAPTKTAYHKRRCHVNAELLPFSIFCDLDSILYCTLYSLPSWKRPYLVISYRHKEVIPMYR